MEQTELIRLWQAYDKRLDEHLLVNRQNTLAITQLKVQALLTSMQPAKLALIVFGLLWVGAIDFILIQTFSVALSFFWISALLQVLITKLAIVIYLYQVVLIRQVDITLPIVETQHKLARLKSSTLWVTRLLFLQLPLWTTFYLNKTMLENMTLGWLVFLFTVIGLFVFAAIWLFRNIRMENRNKKWFRLLFTGKEWTPLLKAMELLEQVAEARDAEKEMP